MMDYTPPPEVPNTEKAETHYTIPNAPELPADVYNPFETAEGVAQDTTPRALVFDVLRLNHFNPDPNGVNWRVTDFINRHPIEGKLLEDSWQEYHDREGENGFNRTEYFTKLWRHPSLSSYYKNILNAADDLERNGVSSQDASYTDNRPTQSNTTSAREQAKSRLIKKYMQYERLGMQRDMLLQEDIHYRGPAGQTNRPTDPKRGKSTGGGRLGLSFGIALARALGAEEPAQQLQTELDILNENTRQENSTANNKQANEVLWIEPNEAQRIINEIAQERKQIGDELKILEMDDNLKPEDLRICRETALELINQNKTKEIEDAFRQVKTRHKTGAIDKANDLDDLLKGPSLNKKDFLPNVPDYLKTSVGEAVAGITNPTTGEHVDYIIHTSDNAQVMNEAHAAAQTWKEKVKQPSAGKNKDSFGIA